MTLRRQQQLLKDGVSTPAQVDQAQAEVDTYDARVAAGHQQVKVAEAQTAGPISARKSPLGISRFTPFKTSMRSLPRLKCLWTLETPRCGDRPPT